MLYSLILALHILVCLVLIAVILLQAGRGGGVADTFGGATQSMFGTRGAVYLTRATTFCAVVFMCTSLSLAFLSARSGRSLLENAPAPAQKKTAPAPQKTEAPAAAQPADKKSAPQP